MFLKPKEFALAVGISYNTLKQHIYRKKVYKSGDVIDTDYELNKIYIVDQTNGKGLNLKKINEVEVPDKKPELPQTETVEIDSPEIDFPKERPTRKIMDASDILHNDLNLRRKLADAEKAEKDNELKSMEIAKKMGELMPIEMVEKILAVNIQTLLRSSENEWENIASEYCEILGGDRSHLSEMVKHMREHLQMMIGEVKMKAAQEIKSVIKDYAAVRGRGQRK